MLLRTNIEPNIHCGSRLFNSIMVCWNR